MVKVMTQEKEHSTKAQTREDRLKIYQKPMVAGRKLIYVCSPLSPNSEDPDEADQEVLENLLRAKRACELLVRIGALPVCPHLYLPYFLDDEIEEERGLAEELALAALRRCHEVPEDKCFPRHVPDPAVCISNHRSRLRQDTRHRAQRLSEAEEESSEPAFFLLSAGNDLLVESGAYFSW